MKIKIILLFFLLFSSIMLYAQCESSLKGKTGPTIVAATGKDPIIVLDGLILSKSDYLKLNINESYSKKFRIRSLNEIKAKKKYEITNEDGVVEIKTNLLYVLNNECLTLENRVKLIKLTDADILDMELLSKEDAKKNYGNLGRNGAIIIKTKQ